MKKIAKKINMQNWIKNKAGFTVLEIVVSMSVFAIFVTLLSGILVTISRLDMKAEATREVQQNTKIMLDQVARYAKEAKKIEVLEDTASKYEIEITIDIINVGARTVQFKREGSDLFVSNELKPGDVIVYSRLNSESVDVTSFTTNIVSGVPGLLEITINSKTDQNKLGSTIFSEDEMELKTFVAMRGQKL